jgi:putative acetyltransferase
MSAAFPKPSLRPYLAADLPLLAEIRLAAIEDLTADDYDEAQRRAWADLADDEAALGEILKTGLSLVALVGGAPVGFIVLAAGG